ncbi:hypothetical protein [Siphonobacter sp. SORGH_AS_1065]|uniref:hypothetical protein n=1 Tax=Siphonobacter sp. SORGH_AS_1065 TaxID=3041795 RepID=UPI00277D1FC7|nr:hypothetical protein [Siphonobacter sp. SORGH_AS_1065]MDQ1088822.1 hypothetical protein [Siphonobacter sp. SORGH_AS_1065]
MLFIWSLYCQPIYLLPVLMNTIIKLGILGALVIFAIFIYSPKWQRKLSEKGFIPNQYRFGDLYNTSNLTRVKEENFYENDQVPLNEKPTKIKNTTVAILGDSFTGMGIDTSLLAGEKNYRRWLNDDSYLTVKLDTSHYNVLLFEIVQRSIIERLNPETEYIYIDRGIKTTEPEIKNVSPANDHSFSFNSLGLDFLSAESVNQRIEFLVFNQKWALKWKEFKAELHATLFDRVVGKAVLTEDKKNMYYDFETDTTNLFSTYYPVRDTQIDSVVLTLNSIRNHYLKMGFDEVVLTIIPNKSLIFEPNRLPYNRIIERIQQHEDLQMPYIDMHRLLKGKPELYHKGDGHWNNKGKLIWLNQVNNWIRVHAPAPKNQV